VQTRPGYFAPAAGPSEAEAARRNFDQEASAADALTDFPVQLAGRVAKTDKGERLLSLIIHVDLARLQFAERDGRYLQKTITRLTASGVNATLGPYRVRVVVQESNGRMAALNQKVELPK